jgi:mutator protein MutT
MKYSISLEPPNDFHPTVEVAGCFCQWHDKILFLKRHREKPQGSTWGLPAGKLEVGETPRQAVIREVAEEVGLDVSEGLKEWCKMYIRLDHVSYVFHLFFKRFSVQPEVTLEADAHEESRWVTAQEALKLPLIVGGKEVIEWYMQYK